MKGQKHNMSSALSFLFFICSIISGAQIAKAFGAHMVVE